MAKTTVYSCDVCGAQKKATNHWWDAYVEGTSLGPSLHIAPFDATVEDDHQTACGERCVHVLVSRFLETGDIEGNGG